MNCTKCGQAINPGERFCGTCGQPVRNTSPVAPAGVINQVGVSSPPQASTSVSPPSSNYPPASGTKAKLIITISIIVIVLLTAGIWMVARPAKYNNATSKNNSGSSYQTLQKPCYSLDLPEGFTETPASGGDSFTGPCDATISFGDSFPEGRLVVFPPVTLDASLDAMIASYKSGNLPPQNITSEEKFKLDSRDAVRIKHSSDIGDGQKYQMLTVLVFTGDTYGGIYINRPASGFMIQTPQNSPAEISIVEHVLANWKWGNGTATNRQIDYVSVETACFTYQMPKSHREIFNQNCLISDTYEDPALATTFELKNDSFSVKIGLAGAISTYKKVQQDNGGKLLSETKLKVGGYDATQLVFETKAPGSPNSYQTVQVLVDTPNKYTIDNELAEGMEFSTLFYDNQNVKKIFDHIMSTVKWK